jgi:hypothetical protein
VAIAVNLVRRAGTGTPFFWATASSKQGATGITTVAPCVHRSMGQGGNNRLYTRLAANADVPGCSIFFS